MGKGQEISGGFEDTRNTQSIQGTQPIQYISTPIFYPNAEPHLGHAYTIVIADVLHRLGKLLGYDSWMSTGMDEHGQKVAKAAAQTRLDPQKHVDLIAAKFQDLCQQLQSSHDIFVRTTSPEHQKVALDLWSRLQAAEALYEGQYEGWYSPTDEAFHPGDYTDKPADCVWTQEKCIFFRLSRFQNSLLEFYEKNPQVIQPDSARNEVISWIKSGLKDLCVTRKNAWGIPISSADNEYVMYVWVDALANYITAAPSKACEAYDMIHIIGKDILRFHSVYWVAMLQAIGYVPPKRIIAHGWWIHGGKKMSKSAGNVITPQSFLEKYRVDAVRYFFTRIKRLGNDMEIDLQEVEALYNSELLGGIGNLGQRLLCLINKYGLASNADLPSDSVDLASSLADVEMKRELPGILNLPAQVREAYKEYDTYKYLEALWEATEVLNRYMSHQEPWKQKKEDRQKTLYLALQGWKVLLFWLEPVLPNVVSKWKKQLAEVHQKRPEPTIQKLP